MTKKVNKKYKDTVFRMLFSKPENALSLYNSLNGTAYTDVRELQYNTLENAIYMNVKNDVSFLVDYRMNLYEHQSTPNPNMPLRNLFYISDVLQAYVRDWSLYTTKLRKIPTPTFYVFYNGLEDMPECMELKLSDAFEIPVDEPSLELRVRMLNINPGYNEKLKSECPVLKEYMMYVEKIREKAAQMELKEAVETAVEECIRAGILEDFLRQQKMEVIKVSIYEYDEEREMRLIREDEREIGMEIGMEKGARVIVSMANGFGWKKEVTALQLERELEISKETAWEYVRRFWED